MKSLIKSAAVVLDHKYLTITDLSVYNPDVPVTNSVLRITIPNWSKYVEVPFEPNSVLNVTSNLLLLSQTADPVLLLPLPSGLYEIRHSICPNDKLFFEYVLFNIQPELLKLAGAVCANLDNPEVLKTLSRLKSQLELSKTLAESCGKPKDAIALFNITSKKVSDAVYGLDNCFSC